MIKRLLSSLFLSLISFSAFSQQPGNLDPSFNGKGMNSFCFSPNNGSEEVIASYLQPDGKLLVAVNSFLFNGVGNVYRKVVMRLLPNGQLDQSFGEGGKVDLYGSLGYADGVTIKAMTLQNDGRIVVVGYLGTEGTFAFVMSLKADGSKDDLFGNGYGYVIMQGATSFSAVQVHPASGNIFAVGENNSGSFTQLLVSGFTSNGQAIEAYNGKDGIGAQLYVNETGSEYASAAVIKGDILYVGATTSSYNLTASRQETHFGVLALDIVKVELAKSFFNDEGATYGRFTVPLASGATPTHPVNRLTTMGLSPDKKTLWLGGYQEEEDFGPALRTEAIVNASFQLVKIDLVNSVLPETFGEHNDGIALYSPTDYSYASSMAINAQGQVLLAGSVSDESNWAALLVNPLNGSLDGLFGQSGVKIYDGQNGNPLLHYNENDGLGITGAHYVSSSGKYLFTGRFSDTPGYVHGYATQVTSKGGQDTYGGATGVVCSAIDVNTAFYGVAVRNDGKIAVVGHEEYAYQQYRYAIGLINADGTKDTLFGGANTSHGALFIDKFFGDTATSTRVVDVKAVDGNKVLIAGDYMAADGNRNVFLMRLTQSGALDTDFNKNGTQGYVLYQPSQHNDYTQGVTIKDNKMLLFGYFHGESNYQLGVVRFTLDGIHDAGFNADTGLYLHKGYQEAPDPTDPGKSMNIQVGEDGKIIGTATNDDDNVIVFQLTKDGEIDIDNFGENGEFVWEYDERQGAGALCIKPGGKIVVAGYTQVRINGDEFIKNAAFIQLLSDGTLDDGFGVNGVKIIPSASAESMLAHVYAVDSKILGVGIKLIDSEAYATVIRLNANGSIDNTFAGNTSLTRGMSYATTLSNNKLYVAGTDRKTDGEDFYYGLIAKVSLGTGPVISLTTLNVGNEEKTFGDEPFLLKPISTSPAPFQYAITQGGCATVNATTGLVTLKCAVSDPAIQIRVTQPAISGYTAATAYAYLTIKQGNPKITFLNQGGLVGDTITLAYSSNSDGSHQFEEVSNDGIFQFISENQVVVKAAGEAQVRLRFFPGNNYAGRSIIANVSGYETILPPKANNDEATLIFGQASKITFDVLTNDQAFTGSVDTKSLDLNPNTPEIDTVFVSPALGLFVADTNGTVTYTPFSGFIGSGSIEYTFRDSKHSVSSRASIFVSVKLQGEAPELQATELITPNGDGLNEAFVLNTDIDKENLLKVFDRSGQELFTQTNYKNDWSGELSNGTQAENGIYYFVFIEGGSGGKQRELKGAFEVRR